MVSCMRQRLKTHAHRAGRSDCQSVRPLRNLDLALTSRVLLPLLPFFFYSWQTLVPTVLRVKPHLHPPVPILNYPSVSFVCVYKVDLLFFKPLVHSNHVLVGTHKILGQKDHYCFLTEEEPGTRLAQMVQRGSGRA